MYSELLSLLPRSIIFVGASGPVSSSTTLGGIDPPRSCPKLGFIFQPLGRVFPRKPRDINRCMSALYSPRTRVLSALGQSVLLNHQTYSTASLTRIRRTFT